MPLELDAYLKTWERLPNYYASWRYLVAFEAERERQGKQPRPYMLEGIPFDCPTVGKAVELSASARSFSCYFPYLICNGFLSPHTSD